MATWICFITVLILKISCSRGEVEVQSNTICGTKCLTDCGRASNGRFWCGQWPFSKKTGSNWDYCSPNNQTYYGKWCMDECSQKEGTRYFWCHTQRGGSWDYCAPARDNGMGNYGCYTTVENVVEYTVIAIIAAAALLLFCGALFCRRG